jgi:hypothetical protein
MKYKLFTAWRKYPCGRENIGLTKFVGASSAQTARHLPKALIAAVVVLGAGVAARASNQIQVEVRGVVERECAISGGSGVGVAFDQIDISKAGYREISYILNCNTPFKYEIMSENGGLVRQDLSQLPHGFTSYVPYDIVVHIPTDDVIINDRCASETIKIGQVTCPLTHSRNGIAIDREARVTVNWTLHEHFSAGQYSDKITLNVMPRL